MKQAIFLSKSKLIKAQTKKDWQEIGNNKKIKTNYNLHTFDPIYFQDDNIVSNTFKKEFDWDICVEIKIKSEKQANQDALKALQLGSNSICFLNFKNHDLNKILDGIQIEILKINFKKFNNLKNIIKQLVDIGTKKIGTRNLKQLKGCFYDSAISEKEFDKFFKLLPNYHFFNLDINASNFQKISTDITARNSSHIKKCAPTFINPTQKILNHITYSWEMSHDFLFEIAKIRSFQISYEQKFKQTPYILSIINTTVKDKEPLIESATKIISAILGGCSGILNQANNTKLNLQQQLILKHEAFLNQVSDPLHGSYYIEKITHSLNQIANNLEKSESLKIKKWKTVEELKLKNKYYQSNVSKIKHLKYGAGIAPFIRGPYASMYCEKKWTIRQYSGFSTAEESNNFYRKNLDSGQTGLSIAFDLPTHRGYDSDHERVFGDVGKAGVAIDTIDDMEVLFKGIDLKKISVSMTMNGAVIPIMAFFIAMAEQKGISKKYLTGTIQNDILKEFMVRNTYIYPPKNSMRIIRDVFQYTSYNMPKFNSISVSGYHMLEAGASADVELAYTLCNGLEYIRNGIQTGLKIDDFAPRLSFFWGIGMNFFMEIAKIRAARILWAEMVAPFKPQNPKSLMLRSHCQTSGWSLTKQIPENNITRTTVEALAAVIGGTQSLHTNALDEAISLPTNESAKIARDTQIFLQNTTDICHAIDPFGGSYYLESLTHELKEKAKKHILEIEKMGGMVKAIELGLPKLKIEASAIKRQAQIDSAKNLIIGLNCFQQIEKKQIKILEVNNIEVQKKQIKRLHKLKKQRNNNLVKKYLEKIKNACQNENENLLELAIDAAKHKATLGEISSAMEAVFTRYKAKTNMNTGIYAMEKKDDKNFIIAQKLTEKFEKKYGRRPRVLTAKLGQDGHDRGMKIIATSFSDIGFDVDIAPLFQTPKEIAKQALENDVHIVGISSLAGGHKTLIPNLIQELDKKGRGDIMIIAGGVIPEKDYQYLYKKGVSKIFGPGTIVLDAARSILNELLSQWK